jgi:hypothetical protein
MNGLTGFSAEELDELLALIGDGDGLANCIRLDQI